MKTWTQRGVVEMEFKWTDLIPSFIGAGTVGGERAEQQLELLRQIYNQDIRLSRPSFAVWLEWWEPGQKEHLQ